MLNYLRVWLNKPLARALEALEDAQCAQAKRQQALEETWLKAESSLDATYRRVHSELGYIDKRSADLRKLEAEAASEQRELSLPGPFAGGRGNNALRRTR